MKRCYKIALCCLFVLLGGVACTGSSVQEALSDDGRLVTGFWIASPLPVHAGQTLTMLGTGFAEGDVVRFESGTGSFESPLAQVSESFACTTVPAGMASGGYDLTLVRGAASQRLARVNLRITLDPTRIPDREGATIKGVVYCGIGTCGRRARVGWFRDRRDRCRRLLLARVRQAAGVCVRLVAVGLRGREHRHDRSGFLGAARGGG